MNDSDFVFLEQYEKHFNTLVSSCWCPAIPLRDAKRMLEIYNTYNPVKSSINLGCSRCVGNMMRYLNKIYTEEKEQRQKLIEETIVKNNKPKKSKIVKLDR